jgi:hypothetical protein
MENNDVYDVLKYVEVELEESYNDLKMSYFFKKYGDRKKDRKYAKKEYRKTKNRIDTLLDIKKYIEDNFLF